MHPVLGCSPRVAFVAKRSSLCKFVCYSRLVCRLNRCMLQEGGSRTSKRSAGHSLKARRQRPSASADFNANKENRTECWQNPCHQIQPSTKAKRKLYCGGCLFLQAEFCIGSNLRHHCAQVIDTIVQTDALIRILFSRAFPRTHGAFACIAGSSPGVTGRKAPAKRHCPKYQSMPSSLKLGRPSSADDNVSGADYSKTLPGSSSPLSYRLNRSPCKS